MTYEQITEEQMGQGLNQCDRCGAIHQSIDLFWNIEWDEHTARQDLVLECMDEVGYDAICEVCFYELAKPVKEMA